MRVLASPVQNSVGLNPIRVEVPVIARGQPFGLGSVVEFDWIGQTPGTDAKLGSPASVFTQVRAATVNGSRTGRVHGIVTGGDIAQNRQGKVVVSGIVDIYVPGATAGMEGNPLVIDANDGAHGKRIKGIVLESRTDWVTALWSGLHGFGNVWSPPSGGSGSGGSSGGGSLPSDPSGGSSGPPSGEPSGLSDPGNVIVPD